MEMTTQWNPKERSPILGGNPSLSLFQKILLSTDGSVTELLVLYAGRPIRARKIEQALRRGAAPAELACDPDTPLLHRKVMLVDERASYVYAESAFVFERLSPSIQRRLLETEAPIGLLWREEKCEMYREIIDTRLQQCPDAAAHFGLPPGAPLLSRTYLLHQQSRPMGIITEKFPLDSFQ
ncbi:chorismate-pyruvate lyase [Janthinobacterium sp. CG_23.3]|uniref:chorismate--pyruvate lyase family protein n=1 Tax=Janthinobacterium sp. CG_23.3 TaxID=3349634 RepID=UPI0038D39276